MGQKYDPKIEREIRDTAKVARDTGSSYKQSERARDDSRRDQRDAEKEEWRERHGKC